MSNPPPLDYRPRESAHGRSWYPLSVALPVYFAGITFLGILAGVVPHFKQIFLDFKTELPAITKLLLQLSSFMTNPGGAVWWILFIAGIPAVVGLARNGRPMSARETPWVWLIILIGWVLFFLVVVVALLAPMIALMHAVSGPPKH